MGLEWLSINPNITWKNVQNNPDLLWNWFRLSQNTFEKEIQQIKLQLQTKAAIN